MIAKVRIAPVESWCEIMRTSHHPLDGMPNTQLYPEGFEVRILAETMNKYRAIQDCGGRLWRIEQSSVNEIRALTNRPPTERWAVLCEHMLEMD